MPLKMTSLPSAERVRELLDYDPETGIFTWKVTRGRLAKAGGVAGSSHYSGYVHIKVDDTRYSAHRLAWLHHYGEDPGALQINHLDSCRSNNAIANLELVTSRENIQHSSKHGVKQNGLPLGTYLRQATQKYQATIKVGGKSYNLGSYNDPTLAAAAYAAALEAVETVMVACDQYPLLLANAVEAATNFRPQSRTLRELPKGVWRKGNRFAASIWNQGTQQHLGTFDTPEQASAAYQEAKARLAS